MDLFFLKKRSWSSPWGCFKASPALSSPPPGFGSSPPFVVKSGDSPFSRPFFLEITTPFSPCFFPKAPKLPSSLLPPPLPRSPPPSFSSGPFPFLNLSLSPLLYVTNLLSPHPGRGQKMQIAPLASSFSPVRRTTAAFPPPL